MTDAAGVAAPEDEIPVLHFATGLPGFPDARHFVLIRLGEDDSLFSVLRCLEQDGLEFVVTMPGPFFPEYEPVIDDSTCARLGIETADDVLLLVIVNVADPVKDSTANLLGPIVVNLHSREAVQAVLESGTYDTQATLVS